MWLSRKFIITVFGMVLVILGALIAAHWQTIMSLYTTLTGSIIALATAYMGGNVLNDHLTKKHEASVAIAQANQTTNETRDS